MGARPVLRAAVLASSALVIALLGLACGATPAKPTDTPASKGDPAPSTGGSCFDCGESVCLTGFYCETAGSAAPACAWSAACAQKATCACLGPQIKGCTCEDRGGAAHVRCSP